MLWRAASEFGRDRRAAVAPLFAVALFGLIAIAGIGMDYGRLMAMSSEMQNAADQAALAAATQLDGKSDSITRAQSAVTNYFANSAPSGAAGELVVNRTVLANDTKHVSGRTSALTDVSFTFYKSYDRSADTFGSTTTDGTQAKVVLVRINARRAYYALTPVVDAFSSKDINVDAVAGIDSSICQLPPLMVCAPAGSNFPTSADIGKGMLLKVASGAWAPGNFGYVDLGDGGNTVKQMLATNSTADSCIGGSSLSSEPGNIANATDYLNTRFDIYADPPKISACAPNGDYCPAQSTRKDLVQQESYSYKNQDATLNVATGTYSPTTPIVRPACTSAPGNNWMQLPATSLPASNKVQGFPRDACHYSVAGCTGGNIGDGIWDIAGYRAAHPAVPSDLNTRYDIYKWERDNPTTGLQPTLANSGDPIQASGCHTSGGKNPKTTCDFAWTNYCSYPTAINGTYHPTTKDRRLLTVAVIDCAGANGKITTTPTNWMEVFLTEPSWPRTNPVTSSNEIYAEVVRVATKPDNTTAYQYYSRNKVVLLR